MGNLGRALEVEGLRIELTRPPSFGRAMEHTIIAFQVDRQSILQYAGDLSYVILSV